MQSHSKSTYFVIVCVQFKKFKYFYCNNIKDFALNDCFIQQVAMFFMPSTQYIILSFIVIYI